MMATHTGALTNATGQNLFVVNVSLNPGHELLDVGRCGHLGRALVVLIVLPEILEPSRVSMVPVRRGRESRGWVSSLTRRSPSSPGTTAESKTR